MMRFLPLAAFPCVVLKWLLAQPRNNSQRQAGDEVMWTEPLTVTQIRTNFSTSTTFWERLLGLTKPLITLLDIGR
jgi:hypothetical protein